jgi:predicted transport protein
MQDMYTIKNGLLSYINTVDFKLERDIQQLCENNLTLLFGLHVVKSQYILQNLKLDTLAFDAKTKSFVVIEYKRDKNFSVIDQGYAYLSLVLNNKADCILEYNESHKVAIRKDDVDWTQTRVIFIAPSFTQYQTQSINFKDLPIELWTITRYANDTLSMMQIQSPGSQESVKVLSSKSKTIEGVSRELKVYTEDDLLLVCKDEIRELYQQFKEALTAIDTRIKIKPTKKYIGFIAKTNFVDIRPQKKALKVWFNLRKGELDDARTLARDVSRIGHWGNGDYELHVADNENLGYVINLAKQSFRKNSL